MADPWKQFRRNSAPRTWRGRLTTAGAVLAGTLVVAGLTAALTGLSAAGPGASVTPADVQVEITALRRELDDARGRLSLAEVRLDQLNTVAKYSTLYGIPADLAQAIHDIALAEGIHPSIGFQLVKVESRFKPDAKSTKGAIGYTQLRLATARSYDSTVTERALTDRDLNLRLGFRFLRDLLARFDQDLSLALLAYNRGPTKVTEMMSRGEDPGNGYDQAVLKGVRRGS